MKPVTKILAATVLGTALLSGCATVEKMDKPTYDRLHAKAKAAYDKSNSVNYAWSTAEEALEQANEAAEKSDWENAIKLVKLARDHSNLAYKQYQSEKNPGPAYE